MQGKALQPDRNLVAIAFNQERITMTDTNETTKDTVSRKELEPAVKIVQTAIHSMEAKYRNIVSTDEPVSIMLGGETSTGYYCQVQVDARNVVDVLLEYKYPLWHTLGEDAPLQMWDELASICGLEKVLDIIM